MPEENGNVGTGTASSLTTKTFYIGTCPGILRIFITVIGLGCIILASIGSPNDLDSYDGDSFQNAEFYGYGLGYAAAEPLNALFIALLVLSWLVTVGFLIFSVFARSDFKSSKLNRILYVVAGITVWVGCICGAVGTYYFWGGCCHVFLPTRGEKYLQYHYEQNQGYLEWCLCTLRVNSIGRQRYMDTYRWRDIANMEIVSAWPHHFIVHIISLVLSAVFGILCFIACCFP